VNRHEVWASPNLTALSLTTDEEEEMSEPRPPWTRMRNALVWDESSRRDGISSKRIPLPHLGGGDSDSDKSGGNPDEHRITGPNT
jgi:hypothetical protein